MEYEYRILNASDYSTEKEFQESINLYGKEGYHIIEAQGRLSVTCVIMQKEEKVIRAPVE
jgi:hypothetical protein